MHNLRTLMLAAVAAVQLTSAQRSDPVLVTAVFDGDTIVVSSFGRVRLLGIDAPEIGHGFDTAAPFGREARDRLTGLVLHRWVRLAFEGGREDAYGRRLAYVLIEDGTFVNTVLVREGLARVSARVPLSRLPELQRAEAEAQTFRRGMWGATPQIPAQAAARAPSMEHPTKHRMGNQPRAVPGRAKERQRKKKAGMPLV